MFKREKKGFTTYTLFKEDLFTILYALSVLKDCIMDEAELQNIDDLMKDLTEQFVDE